MSNNSNRNSINGNKGNSINGNKGNSINGNKGNSINGNKRNNGLNRNENLSFGIVPWFQINREYWFIGQISYSSDKHDFKIDPLRGKKMGKEVPFETAIREFKEESSELMNFSVLNQNCQHIDGLYHVRCNISIQDLMDIPNLFESNRNNLLRKILNSEDEDEDEINRGIFAHEICKLVIIPFNRFPKSNPYKFQDFRIANQFLKCIPKLNEDAIINFPLFEKPLRNEIGDITTFEWTTITSKKEWDNLKIEDFKGFQLGSFNESIYEFRILQILVYDEKIDSDDNIKEIKKAINDKTKMELIEKIYNFKNLKFNSKVNLNSKVNYLKNL